MGQYFVILVFLILAIGFAWYLVKRDQGEHEPVAALWAAFGFGVLGFVLAAGLEVWLLPDISRPALPMATVAWLSAAIAIIEECSKAGLLTWFIHKKRYFNEHTDGVIYYALAGLGFGLPENILYTFQFGAKAGMVRIIMTPLFHAATTGLVGYAVVRVKLDRQSKMSALRVLGYAVGLHALYDFGLMTQAPLFVLASIMTTLGLAFGLFLLFLHARGQDQLSGLSVVGNNKFCRTCGTPNPEHKLYCTHCGNRA